MTDETTLLPCPFCGGDAEIRGGIKFAQIRCNRCDIAVVPIYALDNPKDLVRVWNRRYTEDDLK